jgi:TonB family protein
MKQTASAKCKAQGVRLLCFFALTFALCPPIFAREAVSAVMSPEPKRGISRGFLEGDRHSLDTASLHPKSQVEAIPPFPVLMPKTIVYPRKAVRKGWEGQAVVAAEVLADGSVGQTAVARSSGYGILDEAARDSIKTWKFGHANENKNEILPQFVDIPVMFRLQNEE